MLISFDGISGERLERMLVDPSKLPLGAFRRLAERGFHAVRSHPPTPSLTAVSHIVHVTGALPQATGIVSNSMLDRMKPFGATISGFDAPIRAETLWEAARRQGRRVGVMLYPGADGNGPARTADWMMTWPGNPLAPGRLHAIAASAWQPVSGSDAPSTFSPARKIVLAFAKTSHSVAFVALDATDDGRMDYDRLLVLPESGGTREVRVGDWFPVEVPDGNGRTGSWCKLLALAPDLVSAEIYVGPLSRSTGAPREWVRRLDAEIGFWPGMPDTDAFGEDSPRPDIFLEQTDRLVDFLTRADLLALARRDWDLLLIYQPEVDETSHEFLLVDPAQPRFTPGRSARDVGFVEKSYALAERSLDAIEKALTPSDSLFVTSDHGMTAIFADIALNRILRDAGLVTVDEKDEIQTSSPLVAVTASGIAHVYLNPASKRSNLDRAEQVLKDFRFRGETPFDRIVRRERAGDLGLNAPESGDLIVLAKPGFLFVSSAGGAAIREPHSYGGHGYRNVYRDLDATFFAAGPGIAHERVEEIDSWQIAARVARALGIEPPRQAARP
ncbi:MAG TPA: alkaline phosphatase family protein [Thermoanaerobaculia bacterium]|nr:alkaline phosphatase family protein [Thermoanaerobaculia bacterium]